MQRLSSEWSLEHAVRAYDIDRWGAPFFGVNTNGNMTVRPNASGRELDIYQVAMEARKRGIRFPFLLRFQDLLREKVGEINQGFQKAIDEAGFTGHYRGVFPMKVNHLREVVEEILDAGAPYHFGLEVGSKPELFSAMAISQDQESLLICNGYKDQEFIRTALIGRKLGREVIMVIEKLEELPRIVAISEQMKVEPIIGIRIRLQTKGSGKWARSGGEDAKFGLSSTEAMEAARMLRERGWAHVFKLLHFHVGSQVPDIQTIKAAVNEAARYYAQLRKLGFDIQYLDVGGGLGVNYDGSGTSSDSSTNYSLCEYCQDIVSTLTDVCAEEKVPHPNIVSESGRAIVAQHSVLVVEVFGSIEKGKQEIMEPGPTSHKMAHTLAGLIRRLNRRNRRETLHRALRIRDEALTRFSLGLLDLQSKAEIDSNFWLLARMISGLYQSARVIPDEVRELQSQMRDQFLCNFSVFQSLIDHWAVGQVFPIAPIHRLQEQPERQGTLVDITCDSDGKVAKFIGAESFQDTLRLHRPEGQPYLLGFFLLGAYQDIMGDLHNLFAPVSEVHVFLDEEEECGFYIEEIVPGATIKQVLDDVQYDAQHLVRQMKQQIDQAIKSSLVRPSEGMQLLKEYEEGLSKLTYLALDE